MTPWEACSVVTSRIFDELSSVDSVLDEKDLPVVTDVMEYMPDNSKGVDDCFVVAADVEDRYCDLVRVKRSLVDPVFIEFESCSDFCDLLDVKDV